MGGLGRRTRRSGGGGFAWLPLLQMLFVRLLRDVVPRSGCAGRTGAQRPSAKAAACTKIMIIKMKTPASPPRSGGNT